MLFNVGVQTHGPYLLVTASGDAELPELCALANFPAEVAHRRDCRRAMFDLLALRPVLDRAGHVELGQRIAQTLVGFERIAVVLADPGDRLAAELASQHGAPIRTFSSLSDANDWLVEKP